ncbi:MAG: hypothetical protein IPQ07_11745 [Myxococcales bacterium]|nr:hypothetical protein [Myxococcales bacterium]
MNTLVGRTGLGQCAQATIRHLAGAASPGESPAAAGSGAISCAPGADIGLNTGRRRVTWSIHAVGW